MKPLFLVAGESSGDMHGAHLIRALRQLNPQLTLEGLGGIHMAEAGMTLRHDLAGQGIMGFTEVVKHFLPIRRLFLDTVAHLKAHPPAALILIDYPGFNLRLAQKARTLGIPVIYYISPQVWAWKRKRIHTIARCVDKMLVIFPFEEALYREAGVNCAYIGHPLLDRIPEAVNEAPYGGEMVIGLFPGSRAQEIERLMSTMLDVARELRKRYPAARFVTPCVNEARAAQVRAMLHDFPVEVQLDGMYEILKQARFCLVASGTATLETALFGVPMLLLYRLSETTYWLARHLVHLKYIGIVNILANAGIVPEFIQADATPDKILPHAIELIEDSPARSRMRSEFNAIREQLGRGGASSRAAQEIMQFLAQHIS